MGIGERVGILICGTTLAGVAGMFGKHYAGEATSLRTDSFLKELFETDVQTAGRIADAGSYEFWSNALQWGVPAILLITIRLAFARDKKSKSRAASSPSASEASA
ncbi:MAG: hypothetical protein AAB955_03415 [Patescibacteria group bacterium]